MLRPVVAVTRPLPNKIGATMKFPKPRTRSLRFMSRFDALELHACVEHQDQNGQKFIEQEDDENNPTMFSVYGHAKTGGIWCLEDFKTHSAAVAWMKKEASRCKFQLGYEDFWEHGGKEQLPTGSEIWRRRKPPVSSSARGGSR